MEKVTSEDSKALVLNFIQYAENNNIDSKELIKLFGYFTVDIGGIIFESAGIKQSSIRELFESIQKDILLKMRRRSNVKK